MINAATLLAGALALTATTNFAQAKIQASVYRNLKATGKTDVMLQFKEGAGLNDITVYEGMPKATRAKLVKTKLTDANKPNIAAVKGVLDDLVQVNSNIASAVSTEEYWIARRMLVKNVDATVLEKLAELPNVVNIRPPSVAKIIDSVDVMGDSNSTVLANQWGVDMIKAPAVWAKGNKGKGVVVGGIDTGVRQTHKDLKDNWRSKKGWFDPYDKNEKPMDDNGHGTHTMGSSVGANGIGVAPEATWIACRGCNSSKCSEDSLVKCGEFMVCPTDPDGKNEDCSMNPDVVNNSWGDTDPEDKMYVEVVAAWRKAGIIPVFANGNSGSKCETVGSPASFDNVIAVGATDSENGLATFSSKGPVPKSKLMKPDVSAPGNKVKSASHSNDTDYATKSGTSMACPHATGVVALYLSQNPDASYDDVYKALTTGVDTDLKKESKDCGGKSDSEFPNNSFGYGRLNSEKVCSGGDASKPTTDKPAPKPTTDKPAPKPTTDKPVPKPAPGDGFNCECIGGKCDSDGKCGGCKLLVCTF